MNFETLWDFSEWMYLHREFAHTIFILLFIFACVMWLKENRTTIGSCSLYNVRLAKLKLSRLEKARGIVLGKIGPLRLFSPADCEEFICVTGAMGDGKTAPFAIPSLRNWPHNFWAIDISGDISAAVHKNNQIIFEPLNYKNTIPYNVFYMIDQEKDRIMQDKMLLNLVEIIVPPKADNSTSNFFEEGSRYIVAAAMLAFYHAGIDFSEICHKIDSLPYEQLFSEIEQCHYDPATTKLSIFSVRRESDIDGCLDEAKKKVSFFCTEDMRMILRRPVGNEIAMHASSCENHCCFFNIPDQYIDQYTPLVEIVVYQLLQYLSGREFGRDKLLIVLDEYGTFKQMDISNAMQKYRKRGIRIMVLIQSIMRLDANFGIEYRKELIANCKINVISGEAEPDTQDYFSRKAGTKVKISITKDKDGNVISQTEKQERFIQPDELAKLHTKKKSLIISNGYPFILRQARYFEERSFKKEQKICGKNMK